MPEGVSVKGGEVRTLSERQKELWMSKHPIGGNRKVGNGTATPVGGSVDDNSSGSVASFENVGAVGMGKGNSLMAVAVLVRTSVFGFRF